MRESPEFDKVLYVCRANLGRSQVAMTYHNVLRPHEAWSAGTRVGGMKNRPISSSRDTRNIIEAMLHESPAMDIRENIRTPISKKLANRFGHVVVMAELETVPIWLWDHPSVEQWQITDLKNQNMEDTIKIRDEIKERVQYFIQTHPDPI